MLLQILESVLGKSQKQGNKGDYLFFCPFCHHYKKKLSINIDQNSENFGKWACWVCQNTNNTKGNSIFSLMKKLNRKDLNKIISNEIGIIDYDTVDQEKQIEIIKLPDEYIPLWTESNSISRSIPLNYLYNRNITMDDIEKYQLGYCIDGKYSDCIIIPSYNTDGILNYFIARSFINTYFKYKKPPISNNIIFNEFLINFNMDIILCEGFFDSVSIKLNSIPLLGKKLSDILFDKLINNTSNNIYIYLDHDAIHDAIKIIEKMLMSQRNNVYLVIPNKKKDAGDLLFEENWKLINNSVQIKNTNQLLKIKKLFI